MLAFIPGSRPFDLFDPARKGRNKLYVRRVLITEDADLLPGWLRFVRLVVDSADLPLNVSREMIQESAVFTAIRKGVTNRVLQELTKLAEHEAQFGLLHIVQPTECCKIRKVEPLMRSLEPFDWWFTGLRREQSPTRAGLRKVEDHKTPGGKQMKKVSVLADWTMAQVNEYAETHAIPKLELYARGYTSIGCEPCTAIPDDPANPRAGRWGGKKLECGIHTFSEKV